MRTQEIKDNLENMKSKNSLGYWWALDENIKEAKSMIFELKFLLENQSKMMKENSCNNRLCEYIDKITFDSIPLDLYLEVKLKDWQNLLNWLEGLQ